MPNNIIKVSEEEQLKLDVLSLSSILEKVELDKIINPKDGFTKIYDFFNSSFLLDKKADFSGNYPFAMSYASSFFNKLVNRLLATVFRAMPEIKSKDNQVNEFYKKEGNKLENFLRIAIKNYIVFGFSFLELNLDDEFRLNNRVELKIYGEDLFSVEGVLDQDSKKKLKASGVKFEKNVVAVENGLEVESEKDSAEIFYFKNRRFIKNGNDYLALDNNALLQNGLFIYEKPMINSAFEEFFTLDALHRNYLKTLAGLKTNAITYKTMEIEARKALSENFSLVTLNVSNSWQNKDVASLLQWMDNKPLNETIKIQSQEIESLKQKIIELCDLQDLFTKVDNSSETRIAAENRVATSNLAIESRQNKVNNFIENFIKNFMAIKLDKNVMEIDLELNSVSILQEENERLRKEQDLQKIMQLINLATTSSPAVSNMYFKILKEAINLSSLDSGLLKEVEKIEQEYLVNIQNASQNQQPPIELQVEVAKSQAETNKINAEAKKIELETKLLPKELNFKIEEQLQQNMQEERLQRENK